MIPFVLFFLLISQIAFGAEYPNTVQKALEKSHRNKSQLIQALETISPQQKEGMEFLIANMPDKDLKKLDAPFLIEDVQYAYQAMTEVPWSKEIPSEIFLNDVLPYATVNEHRDYWRKDFHDRFMTIAKQAKTIDQAVQVLNRDAFEQLQVTYNADKRPKAEQSPYESIKAHYATCTGLSILLVDILRSVGIPARMAGIALWPDESGNHTWVEIWDGQWHYLEASVPTEMDHTWFTQRAAATDAQHPIYATSFKKTGVFFPMRWAHHQKNVPAINATDRYTSKENNP